MVCDQRTQKGQRASSGWLEARLANCFYGIVEASLTPEAAAMVAASG